MSVLVKINLSNLIVIIHTNWHTIKAVVGEMLIS